MANKAGILTQSGYDKLVAELEQLKTTGRKEVAEKIKAARGFGDLSENAEYDEAKNEQAELEARIAEIENTLRTAEVISEDDIDGSRVTVGTVAKVYDYEYDEEIEYEIVGSNEIDPFENKISIESPIGAALRQKSIGEEVEFEFEIGREVKKSKLKILDIRKSGKK